jgi:hypothetical protein
MLVVYSRINHRLLVMDDQENNVEPVEGYINLSTVDDDTMYISINSDVFQRLGVKPDGEITSNSYIDATSRFLVGQGFSPDSFKVDAADFSALDYSLQYRPIPGTSVVTRVVFNGPGVVLAKLMGYLDGK